jgi:hypothetical protein
MMDVQFFFGPGLGRIALEDGSGTLRFEDGTHIGLES